MISSQILQATIDKYGQAAGLRCAIYDAGGKLLVRSGERLPLMEPELAAFALREEQESSVKGCLLRRAMDEQEPEYVLAVSQEAPGAQLVMELLSYQIDSLITAYREKFDRDNFIKNLLLDNLLLIDIYNRAKKLRISLTALRAVLVVETERAEGNIHEAVRQLLSGRSGDFVTTVDENHVVVVHELSDAEQPYAELDELSEELETLASDSSGTLRVAYGTPVAEIREVSKSFKEAKLALDVGRIFYVDKNLIAYNSLGIGRLIYQLPLNLCRMFIAETFKGRSVEEFDAETLSTIDKFFENSLNVSETARQLFIHRNTLVYRLDKLQKSTGLDLRVFDDAITFKIAMMVVKYMEYMEKIDY